MPGSQLMSWLWNFWTLLGFLSFLTLLKATPEFSGYLQKILKNHTAHACDGEQLTIICPHKTSISILSAFYGRRVPSQNLCPTSGDPSLESVNCVSATAHQKMMDECQDQRWCHFFVHSYVFGPDPCPETHKYLLVSYKCRPANHRLKTACESEKLQLRCRSKSVLAIYSAIYGRPLQGKPECDSVNGTRTNIVPRQLLEEVSSVSQQDPFSITDYTHGGWYTGPRLSRLQENLMIFTSSLETFAHIWGVPEKVGFYFLCGVSGGLLFLLLLFAPKMTLLHDLKESFSTAEPSENIELERTKLQDEPDDHDDSSSDSSFHRLTCTYSTANNIFGPELTAALEGAADQRGHEGDEIWIPKESSPYAIHKIKSATK
uniref:SUEL-type lectin domain-containing protein n=1 Tax=Salvator merianae TaxID=96440 RepID=A0A8D0BW80_SALMN